MRILLLQDQVYLPSLGGGNKANRLLLEALAARGHECAAVVRAFTTRAGPRNADELASEAGRRGAVLADGGPGRFCFRFRDVSVTAVDFGAPGQLGGHVAEIVEAFRPDWLLVSDDKDHRLVECAVTIAPARVILLLQTVCHLPFGPHARQHSQRQRALMARAHRRVVISGYLKEYLAVHGDLDSTVVRLPVFGPGPFAAREGSRDGFVTMINPCTEKGLSIFLALAATFPGVPFAAVPTWGADDAVLAALSAVPNITIVPPADDIDQILGDTRVLLAPSLWPESFGYVVVEAMLRGIPVVASDRGGLPEAKLGVDYTIPVRPAEWRNGVYVSPEQDLGPWVDALTALLRDDETYRRCSAASHQAAAAFASQAGVERFEACLEGNP